MISLVNMPVYSVFYDTRFYMTPTILIIWYFLDILGVFSVSLQLMKYQF